MTLDVERLPIVQRFAVSELPEQHQQSTLQHIMAEVDIVNVMRDRIVEHFHPLKIILFGSRARGDGRPDSDVDLIVVLSKVDDSRRTRVAIRGVLCDLPAGKDILVATPEELESYKNLLGSVFRPALREGKVIYEQHA